jgi:hypothetical protein
MSIATVVVLFMWYASLCDLYYYRPRSVVKETTNKRLSYKTLGSHIGGYEELCLLGYNAK